MIVVVILSIIYAILGYLCAEAVWRDPEIRKEIEKLRSIAPPEIVNSRLAIAKLVIAVFWPFFFFGSFFIWSLQKLGIIRGEKE